MLQKKLSELEQNQIWRIGQEYNLQIEAANAIRSDTPVKAFSKAALDHLLKGKGEKTFYPPDYSSSMGIGLSKKEREQFLISDILRCGVDPTYQNKRGGLLSEVKQTMEQKEGRRYEGYPVPLDILFERVLTAGTATDGAELVADNLLAGSFIDLLRNLTACITMGATVLPGLVGDVLIPRQTSGATAGWLSSETTDVSSSEAQFDQISMTPKTIGTYSTMSRQLILQSSPAIEPVIRNDLAKNISVAIDQAALYGTGSSGQPTGIANTNGINAPTAFAAAVPIWAEVVAMESAVAVDNALQGQTGYVIEPTMRGQLRAAEKVASTGVFIMDSMDALNGHQCVTTSQVTDGDIFFGNWADLIIGMWGGLDVICDPYTNALDGSVRIIVKQSVDVAVRHPVSFAFNNDTP
jgi:HK97 family phage major capsid protein